ncbi:carbohydrate ABC transporter permease, partial [Vallitalea guaymasensis]
MNKLTKTIVYVVITIICILTLLPLIWMLSASLKLDKDVFSIPIQWIPQNPQWKNYITIWTKIPFGLFVMNTTKLTVIITLIQLFTSSFAAYGFSKCEFKGRNVLFLFYIATIAIPWQVYMLPQYTMMNKFGLIDTHTSIILLQSFTAFGVFLIRQFYLSIPNELLEAGRIDGMSEYGIYFRIILPLSKPALSTLTIFSFVGVWNDFMGPMIYFNSESNKTIQLGI